MKTIRNPRQGRLIDPFEGVISGTGRKLMSAGWQALFRSVILQKLPAVRLGQGLSDDMGRPSAELYAMCGLLLIKDFQDWTVPQTLEAVLFRSDVQFALNLEPGFEISQRTIERYLARLQSDEDLAVEMMHKITAELVKELDLTVTQQRLDSTHILSDMAVFGRTRMMGIAVKRFLAEVKRRDETAFQTVPEELRGRYQVSVGALFADAKTTEQRQKTRQQAAEDLHAVLQHFASQEAIVGWRSYCQLRTMFEQQCEMETSTIVVKPHPGGAVLINGSDPEATYCGRKGAGYQTQLVETCSDQNDVQLILATQVETASASDAQALQPLLKDLQERGLQPKELSADCAYGSDENVQHAQSCGVELTSPVPGGKKFDAEEVTAAGFTVDAANHTVISCPAGHQPLSSSYNEESDRYTVHMPPDRCATCPLREECLVRLTVDQQEQPQSARAYFTMSEHRSCCRRAAQQQPAFRERYALRSGIESTNSGLKRRCGLKRLRVRGFKAVKSAVLLKVVGWNILRAASSAKIRMRMRKFMENGGIGGQFGFTTLTFRILAAVQKASPCCRRLNDTTNHKTLMPTEVTFAA